MNAPDPALHQAFTRPMPHVMNTYGRLPFALSHGRGCWVWDTQGKRYLDGLGGIAVNTLGHGHPKLVPALQDQVAKMIHCSNYYEVPLQEQLAAKLCELSGLSAAFFCNSGLEANEGALKIARKFGHDKGIERPEIIVYEKAFHGRSLATLSATGNPGWLIFGLLLGRLTGIYHPPAPDERPLGRGRQVLGWVMVAIFVLCFTPSPFR